MMLAHAAIAPPAIRFSHRFTTTAKEFIMPIILWLLGVPLSVILIFMLLF
jgi:hypothetical protein